MYTLPAIVADTVRVPEIEGRVCRHRVRSMFPLRDKEVYRGMAHALVMK
jgi:hypothetical protein